MWRITTVVKLKIPYKDILSITWFSKYIVLPLIPFVIVTIIRYAILDQSFLESLTSIEFTFSMVMLSLLVLSSTNKLKDTEIRQKLFNIFAIFVVAYVVFLTLGIAFDVFIQKQIYDATIFFSGLNVNSAVPSSIGGYISYLQAEDLHFMLSRLNMISVALSIFVIPYVLFCKEKYKLDV